MVKGIPYLGTTSLRCALVISLAFLVQVGKASAHPKKVQSKTKRYLNPWLRVVSVKSTSISSNGDSPQYYAPAGLLGPWKALFCKQVIHCWRQKSRVGVGGEVSNKIVLA